MMVVVNSNDYTQFHFISLHIMNFFKTVGFLKYLKGKYLQILSTRILPILQDIDIFHMYLQMTVISVQQYHPLQVPILAELTN